MFRLTLLKVVYLSWPTYNTTPRIRTSHHSGASRGASAKCPRSVSTPNIAAPATNSSSVNPDEPSLALRTRLPPMSSAFPLQACSTTIVEGTRATER